MHRFMPSRGAPASSGETSDVEKTQPDIHHSNHSPQVSTAVGGQHGDGDRALALDKAFMGNNDSPAHFKLREKWRGCEHAIQPHTDEGGDAYYIGDHYEGITCAEEWHIDDEGPYLKYVKHLSKTWSHLEYLAHWMEVTAAPPKWKFLKHYPDRRDERAKRTKVCVIDYTGGHLDKPAQDTIADCDSLRAVLDATPQSDTQSQIRLIVVEDLSRDVIELLGARFDVDPLFFLSHIGDYLFHNSRDPWAELPCLDVDNRQRAHLSIQYLRARYFKTEAEFRHAEKETGLFNVLRRLDSDRSRERLQGGALDRPEASVTLTRAKTSLWIKPRGTDKEPVTAILLVDPTDTTGHPLWGGYRPFGQTPSMEAWKINPDRMFDAPEHKTLFEDVVYWSQRFTRDDAELILQEPRWIAAPVYKLVVADWLVVLKYMATIMTKIEWELERPHWDVKFRKVNNILSKISPWRRNIGHYQTMITDAMSRLFPAEHRSSPQPLGPSGLTQYVGGALTMGRTAPVSSRGTLSLLPDFQNIHQQMYDSQARMRAIEAFTMNAVNTEEAIRATMQNKHVARLTFLATIFIPLNFASSFLSISPTLPTGLVLGVFFAIGLPITLVCLLVVDLGHPDKNGYIARGWRAIRSTGKRHKKRPGPAIGRPKQGQEQIKRKSTLPWTTSRSNTVYTLNKG